MEWQVLILLGGVVTFFVSTVLPLLKILIKTNSTIEGNTKTIETINSIMHETINLNKKEHDHFYKSINHLTTDVEILKDRSNHN